MARTLPGEPYTARTGCTCGASGICCFACFKAASTSPVGTDGHNGSSVVTLCSPILHL